MQRSVDWIAIRRWLRASETEDIAWGAAGRNDAPVTSRRHWRHDAVDAGIDWCRLRFVDGSPFLFFIFFFFREKSGNSVRRRSCT